VVLGHDNRKLSPGVKKAVGTATSLEDLHAALEPVIDSRATPDLVRTARWCCSRAKSAADRARTTRRAR
jgi:hypothetical protein